MKNYAWLWELPWLLGLALIFVGLSLVHYGLGIAFIGLLVAAKAAMMDVPDHEGPGTEAD